MTQREKYDKISELLQEAADLMQEFHSERTRRAGPYSNVGQAAYRVRAAGEYWREAVPRPL